ncbi:putative bifunctional diguanylate cyclase/phosphodiesterase [Oricola cellulosilytica]|uniref:Sensor domain-containing phosphodiesterase n=1 Tax=Oricola cellulosilytica TaxID=1429082 RepID=A0A4R0PBD2_9HYPH|nr:sensor domain-containing phosphodiesterase [Oricola cellulosilytica]TCD13530.1 sensor domain-containing phosphodiesterase [Oricola cellulosilytica]
MRLVCAAFIAALSLCLTLLTAPAGAVEPISISRNAEALDLSGAVTIYHNRGQNFQISTAPGADGIVRTIEIQATREDTEGHWAVFALANTTDTQIDRLIVAPHFRLVGSDFFWPDLGSRRIVSITPSEGFALDRVESSDADIFSITLNPGAVVTFVAELASPNLPQVYLWEADQYKDIVNSYTLYRGIVLGIAGLLALFLTILFVVRGTSMFPAAAALAWAALAYICVDFGFIERFFEAPLIDIRMWRAMSEVSLAATLALFIFTYLNLNRWNDHLSYGAIAWVLAIVALSALVFYDPPVAAGIARISIAITAVFGLGLIAVFSWRGFDRAIMLVPAWSLLIAWILAGYLTISGAVDNDIIQPALAGGLVLVVLLIGFTIMQTAFSGGAFQQTLLSNVERQALAVRGSGGIVWDWDVVRDRLTTTPDLAAVMGLENGMFQGPPKNWLPHIHGDDRDRFRITLDSVVEKRRGKIDLNIRMRGPDNHFNWYSVRARPVIGANGEIVRCIGTIIDVSDQKRSEERLLHDAVHDNLTGLPNRQLFMDRMRSAIALANIDETIKPTALIIDMDRFRQVNESIGMAAGDTLLITIARRLRRLLRPHDTIARLSGNQFGIILLSETDPERIADFADAVKKSIKTPISFAERQIILTASIGLATWTHARAQHEDLLGDAELALFQAKRFGGDRVEPFRPAFRTAGSDKMQLESDLRRAIERGEISLAYQPIVRADDLSIAGFEALLRWNHPRRGEVQPAEFITLAERSELIVDLGNHALELAMRRLMDWDVLLPDADLFLSVNVSSQQVMGRDFANTLSNMQARFAHRKHTLRLEITETVLMQNPEHNAHVLEKVKSLGIGLAMDDFGTGYSSLAYLSKFPFDTIKLDQSLVRNQWAQRDILLQSVISMADNLGLSTVVEGVETEDDLVKLRKMGCRYIQGFIAGVPVNGSVATDMVAAQNPLVKDDAAAE